ncbi:MAG: glutaredoxin [Firmicutes bacterium]|nr:glutaredoxin [Bacillota bacterium]
MKIYGSMLCPDCVRCREELDKAGIAYEFLDFGENLQNLKDFLKIRDGNPLFDQARREGKIGIPCIVRDDESVTLDWDM